MLGSPTLLYPLKGICPCALATPFRGQGVRWQDETKLLTVVHRTNPVIITVNERPPDHLTRRSISENRYKVKGYLIKSEASQVFINRFCYFSS